MRFTCYKNAIDNLVTRIILLRISEKRENIIGKLQFNYEKYKVK